MAYPAAGIEHRPVGSTIEAISRPIWIAISWISFRISLSSISQIVAAVHGVPRRGNRAQAGWVHHRSDIQAHLDRHLVDLFPHFAQLDLPDSRRGAWRTPPRESSTGRLGPPSKRYPGPSGSPSRGSLSAFRSARCPR